MNDLISIVLTLQPITPPPASAEHPLPQWWGRAVHALLLDAVRQQDDVLAAELHDTQSTRPFTVSTLMGPSTRNGLNPESLYRIRLTAFRQDVADALLTAARPGGALAPGRTVELDYIGFRVLAVDSGRQDSPPHQQSAVPASPWAALTSYQALSAPYLLAKIKAPRGVTLKFTSPTTFKSHGMHVPVPLPSLLPSPLPSQCRESSHKSHHLYQQYCSLACR